MGGGPIPVQRNERAGNRDSGRVQCLDGALPSPQVRNSAQETEARAKRLDAHRASGWNPRQKGREEFESHPGNWRLGHRTTAQSQYLAMTMLDQCLLKRVQSL